MTNFTKNILFLIISTLTGVALMWWVYHGFHVRLLANFFGQRTNYVWISLTLLAGVAANVLRSIRWKMLLHSADIHISARRSIELIFIAYLVNSVTPRLGELVRALLVKRGNAEVSSRALGTVVVEKLADIVCLMLLIALVITLHWSATIGIIQGVVTRISWAGPRIMIALIVLFSIFGFLFCLKSLRGRIRFFVHNLWHGITAIAHLRSPLSFATLCVSIWTCNFLQLFLLIPCFEALSSMRIADALHVFAAASVGVLLPTPSGAGTWHFAIVKTLTAAYHIAKPIAQSFALITHGLKTALVMLLGILGYASYYSSVWAWWQRHR